MNKHTIVIEPDENGNFTKTTFINGLLVDGEQEQKSSGGFWSFFSFCNRKYNDNGREYNPASDNWEYTAEANGNANPCQCNYEAPQDYQGSVPVWDGS
jgi:hypothetical protein